MAVLYPLWVAACHIVAVLYLVSAHEPAEGFLGGLVQNLSIFIEILSLLHISTILFLCITYPFRKLREAEVRHAIADTGAQRPSLAALYLCCNDFDRDCFETLLKISSDKFEIIVHDDSSHELMSEVENAIAETRATTSIPITLFRRSVKSGGKAGAVNSALSQISKRQVSAPDYLLMCDSDSIVIESTYIARALEKISDMNCKGEPVAVLQLLSSSCVLPEDTKLSYYLSASFNMFGIICSFLQEHGWLPFFGHNAIVQYKALVDVGGLCPGFYSDDLEVSVRLQCAGYRIVMDPSLLMGERHPADLRSFRLRNYKWAYGCMQTLTKHCWTVASSPRFHVGGKICFVWFCLVFLLTPLSLVHSLIMFVVNPALGIHASPLLIFTLPIVPILPCIIFSLSHSWVECRRYMLSTLALIWVVSASDFSIAHGIAKSVIDIMQGKIPHWVPTNSKEGSVKCEKSSGGESPTLRSSSLLRLVHNIQQVFLSVINSVSIALKCTPESLLQSIFGLIIIGMSAHCKGTSLRLSGLLIGCKHFMSVCVAHVYTAGTPSTKVSTNTKTERKYSRVAFIGAVAILFLVLPIAAIPPLESAQPCGQGLFLKAIHYSPWRASTGPGRSPYPSLSEIREDMEILKRLNVNAIKVVEPEPYVLDEALVQGICVIYVLDVHWKTMVPTIFDHWSKTELYTQMAEEELPTSASLGDLFCVDYHAELGQDPDNVGVSPKLSSVTTRIKVVADRLRDHPALHSWIIGPELPGGYDDRATAASLSSLVETIRSADPLHPVSHMLWPISFSLIPTLNFLDYLSFNVYPFWPPQVPTIGYGSYLRTEVIPFNKIAGQKIFITEFGVDSLTAGEDRMASVLADCWREIWSSRDAIIGGTVFEFADEWWKNYDNPIRPGSSSYWEREFAMHDETVHDLDPEEHYGVLYSNRTWKKAAYTVQELFAQNYDDAREIPQDSEEITIPAWEWATTIVIGGCVLGTYITWTMA